MDNARALFERALTAATPEGAPKLWDRFLAFEYEHGSLAAALAVQVWAPGTRRQRHVQHPVSTGSRLCMDRRSSR